MYQLKKLKILLLLLFVAVTAKAQPEAGKIYRFVNKANPEQSLAVVSETKSSVSPTADHYLQYWLLETHPGNASTWTLRNLGNGKYLQRAGRSVFWGFVDAASDATPLYYLTQDRYCTFSSANNVNDGACMHYASSQGGIVGWDFSADATQWTMTEISSVKADDLTANWEALDEFNKAYDDDMAKDCASALDALFADAACTTLESTYASMSVSAIQEDANYKALPAALQELVLKVRNGVWTEANFVDGKAEWESDQAKKFRVQLYEPHSIAGDITGWLGINAHNNMDNPTGIFADCRDVVYVMVEGIIKEGASLYLYGLRGHGQMGSYNDGNAVQLHEGLNVVPYISDGNALWINYVVDTYNGNGSTDEERFQYKLSNYEPLKINIAGGHINGYYNAVGDDLWGAPDDDTDWAYYKDRASLESFTLLSHRVTMQFYMYTTNGSPGLYNLLDNIAVPENPYCFSGTKGTSATFSQYEGMGLDASTGKINIMLEAWNRIAYSEFATLGVLDAATIDKMNEKYPRWYNNWTERGKIYDYTTGNDGQSYKEYCGGVDYSEYFNHHCLAISNTTGYMSGGWKSSNYNINTAESIIDKIANEAGPVWGPAHEIGHQHQALFTLNGLTEVTNNLHSNVAVWYMGMGTSRVNGTEGSLASVLEAFNTEGSDYYTNNIWALTQMYYRLWLYYHLAGKNTQFYPRLMENLRREPLEKGYNVGPGGLLRFYKHCCVAAGEDLTEFFRAHGLLSVMTDRFVGDYSNSVYNQSQEQIDAAIAEVKALGLPVNIAPLFISDATPDVTYGHDGTTQRSYWDGNSTISGNNAEVGSYIDFVNGEAVGTAPTLTIESTTVTIDGLDGVGIAIFNEEGEIVGFSTKSTFEISEECAALLASGEATVKAVNADNSTVPIEVTDPTQIKYGLLGDLLDEANGMLALSDDTNTKLGWYRPSALKALNTAYTEAKEVYDERDANSYTAAYDMLKIAYDEVRNNADAVISLKTGSGYAYRLVNKAYPERSMVVDASDSDSDGNSDEMFALATEDTDVQKWYFETSDTEGRYYLKNKGTGKYPGNTSTSAVLSADKTEDTKGEDGGAYAYELRDMGNGLWALVGSTGLHCSAWQSYNIVGWGTDAEATLWYITAVEVDDIIEARDELEYLMQKTEALIDEVGEVVESGSQKIELTEDSYYCNARCLTTQWDVFSSYSVLCDGNIDTYLHTDYSGNDSEDGLAHYIRMDMGENSTVEMFKITYTTRNYTYPLAPTSITVEGSNDLNTWHTIVDAFTEGLPDEKGTSFATPVLSNGLRYRYVRLIVNSTITNQEAGPTDNKHRYFALSELGILNVTPAESLNTTYESMTEGVLLDAFKANLAAQGVLVTATTSAEYKAAYTTLETKYNALLAAKKVVDDAALGVKKNELQDLIDSTTSLINSCGTVEVVEGGALTLSTTSGDDVNYLTAGPNSEPSEGDLSNLIDNDSGTSFTSNWGSQTGNPYLQVQLPNGQELGKFIFTFTARQGGGAPTPSTIVVSGSNDGQDFTTIETFTKEIHGFPAAASGGKWTSPEITDATAYKYLRFTVTKSERTNSGAEAPNGYYHFGISHFGVSAVGGTEVTLLPTAGGATKEDVLAAYNQNAEAQAVHDMATTEAQLQKAIEKLTAAKEALENAKGDARDYTVTVVGGNSQGGVDYGGVNHVGGSTFSAPVTLKVGDLTAIPLDGYVAKSVTLNGTTIIVTYNKVYTVKVTGGKGNGGITYNGTTYANGETFDVLESSFDEKLLKADTPAGYTLKGNLTVDENGIISVAFSAIPLVDTEKYYTFECLSSEAHKTERFIRDDGTVINGQSAEGSLFRFEAADDDNGYYIKSYVTDNYINHTTDGSNKVYASGEKNTIWTMAVPSHTPAARTLTVGNNLYLNNNGSVCKDNSCTNLRSLDHTNDGGAPGSGNACSLWTITEGTPLDMTDLKNLIDATNNLIISCYQNGNIDGKLVYFNSVYVTADVMTDIKTAVANAQAKYDAGRATTQGEYNTALTALQTAKNTLTEAKAKAEAEAAERLASREALRNQIDALSEIIANCGVVKYGQCQTGTADVPLTEANLSTNAQEKSEGPIENLLKDDDSFFHSSWQAAAGATHYLQVDLGEGKTLQEFVFGYTTRDKGPHPYIIVVSGSNSPDSDFEDIKVFNSVLPRTGSTGWEAPAPIKAEEPYRYLRFTVTKSSDLRSYGEYCFAMSKFGLKTITYSENEDYYVESVNLNSSVTEEQLLTAYRTMVGARELDNANTTKSTLDEMIETLKTLGNDLESARTTNPLPVVLTTDVQNPILYTLSLPQRGDNGMVLQYEPADNHLFDVVVAVKGSAKQAFYFMPGDERTQVYVLPYAAGQQVLAADNTGNGDAKVFAKEKGTMSFDQWTFVEELVGTVTYYNLQPVGTTSAYFSNIYGVGNKMGFYSTTDEGSRLTFTPVEIEGSAAYNSLKVYYDEAAKVPSSEIVGGSNPGYYPEEQANAYNEAYATATSLLTGEEASYEANFAAYNALKVANEALVLNMPEVGKYYTIASACSDHRGGQLMYSTGENAMVFSREMTRVKPEALWTFTSDGYLENLQTGCSVSTASTGGAKHKLGESPKKMEIKSISVDGQVLLTPNGGQPLHAQDNGSVVVGWGAYDAGSASAWRIVEVEDMSLVNFALNISKFEHAGLYLNYPVTIPDGVKAYYLDGKKITIDNGVGSLNLTKIEDKVIPARTAVILYAPHGEQTIVYDFQYAEEPIGEEYTNLFTGSTYQTYREAEVNHYYYVFGQNNGEIGLYKNGVKYDATGAEGTTHYKMSANKILFDWDGSVSNVSSFRFRLGTGGQATSLEDALMMDNTIIYDLYGRRILEVKTSGLYIVNGEKRYIQVK